MERARAVIVTLAGLLLLLSVQLVRPFLSFFLLAVLLAYPLRPLQVRLEPHVGPKAAAGLLVLGATVAIILPVLWLLRIVLLQVTSFLDRIRDGEITFTELETRIQETTGREVDLLATAQETLRETGIGTVNGALDVFGTVTSLLIGLALTMFLLYYFLKDAERFNRWLRATVPLPDHIYDDLRREFDDVMWAVLASHVLIAIIQGVVAGAGLVVLGIPSALFWTAVMIFLAVLPIIGSFMIWGPAAVYLFSIGDPLAGVVLLIYGAIVVSFCDDFLRPIIIDRHTETRLNPSAVIIGILGGVYVFGFIGIFFGPVLIGSLRAVLDVYRREYLQDGPATADTGDDADAPATADTSDDADAPATADPGGADPIEEPTGEYVEESTGDEGMSDPQA